MLGVFILVCAVVGLWGFLDGLGPGHRNKDIGLVIFSWLLVASSESMLPLCSARRAESKLTPIPAVSGIITLVVGSIIWFFTLRERADFEKIWKEQDGATQAFLQDSVSWPLRCKRP